MNETDAVQTTELVLRLIPALSFRFPWMLTALAIPAALAVWVWRRRGGAVALPFDHGRLRAGAPARFFVNLAETLPALILAVVILMLAGPVRFSEPRTKRVMTNIELCVDVSGSMMSPFGDGTRYDMSMKAIDKFLDSRRGDAFGLTFFGNNYLHWVPLTSDVSAIKCAPPFMKPEVAPLWMSGTEIGKALLGCRRTLVERQEGDRAIILISDGASFDLGGGNDEEVARLLKRDGIVVYAIHIDETEIPDPIVTICSITGGDAFAPDDPSALEAIFKRIDQMTPTRLEKTRPETLDDFIPYGLLGLGLLSVASLALFGARYTPW